MNVVVTGGAGYIGGTVAMLLIQAGHNVKVDDNFCHSRGEALPNGVELVEADIAQAMPNGNISLEDIAAKFETDATDPKPRSERQEQIENLIMGNLRPTSYAIRS